MLPAFGSGHTTPATSGAFSTRTLSAASWGVTGLCGTASELRCYSPSGPTFSRTVSSGTSSWPTFSSQHRPHTQCHLGMAAGGIRLTGDAIDASASRDRIVSSWPSGGSPALSLQLRDPSCRAPWRTALRPAAPRLSRLPGHRQEAHEPLRARRHRQSLRRGHYPPGDRSTHQASTSRGTPPLRRPSSTASSRGDSPSGGSVQREVCSYCQRLHPPVPAQHPLLPHHGD